MFFLQALQIDIEKWRHVYMMLGMVWALEAARLRWSRGEARPSARDRDAALRLSGINESLRIRPMNTLGSPRRRRGTRPESGDRAR